ncbi:MAG: SGNH/GDSL hydrolase family protein, partial [Aquihabitans sp.]
ARPIVFVALCIVTVLVVAWSLGNDDGGDETATTAPKVKATTTSTLPVRIPTADAPLKVLVAGDSLVGWIAPALEQELPADDPVEVIDDWKGSTGLVRTDYFDWPAKLTADMTQHDPDVVVLGFGGNDTQGITLDDGTVLQLGTPEWATEYQRRIGEVLDIIEKPGRTVYWIGMPLTRSDAIEELRPVLTEAVEDEFAGRPWAHFVDTRDALAPDGTFVSQLPGDDGQLVTTMAPDDIHPSLDGGVRIVRVLLPEISEERHLSS